MLSIHDVFSLNWPFMGGSTSAITFSRKVSFLMLLFILDSAHIQAFIPHLSFFPPGCPQTCYHWAAKVNQTDKRLHIHYRYKHGTSSERRTQHFCSSLSINSWLSVFGLSLRQPFSHEKLTRSLPCRNQLPSFDESVPFISVNCLIKDWFLSFTVLILRLLVSHRNSRVKIWTLYCCGLPACWYI